MIYGALGKHLMVDPARLRDIETMTSDDPFSEKAVDPARLRDIETDVLEILKVKPGGRSRPSTRH